MDDETLLQLIRGGESEQVERKEQLKNKKTEVCRAICAFANDFPRTGRPGVVVIGQNDKGRVIGLPITDELVRELSDLRNNGLILPFPQMSVRRVLQDGTAVAVVIVEPSSAPPLRYDGRTWIRVGSTTRLATSQEEAILTERRQAANLPFDARPLPPATIADLDLNRFQNEFLPQLIAEDVLQENHRPIHQQMASLRLVSPGDFVPTATGLLLAGRDPQAHLPGSYTQFVRFDGRQLSDPIRPFGQVTVDTIGQPGLTDYRNPTLAGVLNRLGFVQRFGVGIQVSRDRLARNGNPPLGLQASISAVAAIVGLKR